MTNPPNHATVPSAREASGDKHQHKVTIRKSDKLKPVIIQVTERQLNYFRITAINRFFDNIERALHGDKECKTNLLAEDLQDAREYYEPVFRAIQQAEE